MTYPARGRTEMTAAWLGEAVALLKAAGIEPAVVSTGGSPTSTARMRSQPRASIGPAPTSTTTAIRHARAWVWRSAPCASSATVVSRPTDGRAILDAGSKTLSSDLNGLDGFGLITEYPQAVLAKFSEEHGHVDCSASNARPRIGERVTIIPNHACAVTNLHDVVYGVRGDQVERVFRVEARGRVQ